MPDSSSSAAARLRSPSSVLGGKNSKEKDGPPPERRSSMRISSSLGGGRPGVGAAGLRRLAPLRDQLAIGRDVAPDVREGAPVAGEGQARVELPDAVQRGEELAHRVRRMALVEVQG